MKLFFQGNKESICLKIGHPLFEIFKKSKYNYLKTPVTNNFLLKIMMEDINKFNANNFQEKKKRSTSIFNYNI